MYACSIAFRCGRSPRSVSRPVGRRDTRSVARISQFKAIRTYSSANENQEAFPAGKYSTLPRNEIPDILYDPDEVIEDYQALTRLLIVHDEETLAELEDLKNNEDEMKEAFASLQKEFPRQYGKLTYAQFHQGVVTAIARNRTKINEIKLAVGEPTEEDKKEAESIMIIRPDEMDANLDSKELPEEAREVLQTAKDVINDLSAPSSRLNVLEQYVTEEYPMDLRGPFGTRDKPVVVPSFYPTRIVGCSGDYPHNEHGLLWHIVNESRPTVCLECGQYFKLKKLDESLLEDDVNQGERTVEYLV